MVKNPFCNILPYEVIGYIFTYIQIEDMYKLSLTNKENQKLVNDIIDTEYFMNKILTKQFTKKTIDNKLKNFINYITKKQSSYWMNILSTFYINKNIIPQREIMLEWSNYHFLISSIIFENTISLKYLFLTYKINSFYLSNIIDCLKYYDKQFELDLLLNESNKYNIFNTEICDVQLNLYALPFIIDKENTGKLLLDLLYRRVGPDYAPFYTKEIFTVWLKDDLQYLGEIKQIYAS